MQEERPDQLDPKSEQPLDDQAHLDDLDPEEEGEDVKGGGWRPASSSHSSSA